MGTAHENLGLRDEKDQKIHLNYAPNITMEFHCHAFFFPHRKGTTRNVYQHAYFGERLQGNKNRDDRPERFREVLGSLKRSLRGSLRAHLRTPCMREPVAECTYPRSPGTLSKILSEPLSECHLRPIFTSELQVLLPRIVLPLNIPTTTFEIPKHYHCLNPWVWMPLLFFD